MKEVFKSVFRLLFLSVLCLTSCKTSKMKTSDTTLVFDQKQLSKSSKDQSATIQKVIERCYQNGIDTLLFPKGVYYIKSIDIEPGLVIQGEKGTIFKKTPNAGKWARMFTTQNNKWSSKNDSEPLVFKNITFDGNKENQGPYKKYELQQQHILFLEGDKSQKGRLVAIVEDCVFRESVADGITVYRNVDATIKNCSAHNVFRGGVTIVGGHSKIYIDNLTTTGDVDATGIDVEVDGMGYNDKYTVDVEFYNSSLESGDFDVNLRDGSTFVADNIKCKGPGFFLRATNGSTFEARNSSFYINRLENSKIIFPGQSHFYNCEFYYYPDKEKLSGLDVYMETSYRRKGDQELIFEDCDFVVKSRNKNEIFAIHNRENFTNYQTNIVQLKKCVFSKEFESVIFLKKGGNYILDNVYVKSGVLLTSNSYNGKSPTVVGMKNIRLGSEVNSILSIENESNKDAISLSKFYLDNPKLKNNLIDKGCNEVILINETSQNRNSSKKMFNEKGLLN